jgi:hypothetical protein
MSSKNTPSTPPTAALSLLNNIKSLNPMATSSRPLAKGYQRTPKAPALQPQAKKYQRLPNELIIEILSYALGLHNPPAKPIDSKRFHAHLSRYGRLGRQLTLSKGLYPLVLEAFYRHNIFLLSRGEMSFSGKWELDLHLPSPHARPQVRRLEVNLELHARWTDNTLVHGSSGPMTTVPELRKSTAWRALIGLSTKFPRLETLVLMLKFESSVGGKEKEAFWDVVRSAGVVLKARRKVTVKTVKGYGEEMEAFREAVGVESACVEWVDGI